MSGGFKGEIFIQRGGHDELSGNKSRRRRVPGCIFIINYKTILRLVTGN
ncbi:hypothetical protein KCP71_11670 [Salmonella enterica subsp. enterica]|nr:hypothetical protein KCP71_11670 [Salmonella enterica subsp. enterica]